MPRVYDWTRYNVATPGGASYVRVTGSNSRRVTICLAAFVATTIVINDRDGGALGEAYASLAVLDSPAITYRDFGPLIQGEIWVASSVAIANLHVTEIFYIGG